MQTSANDMSGLADTLAIETAYISEAIAYATNGRESLHWLVLVDGQNAYLHGFRDEDARDMAYAQAQSLGGKFNRMAKGKGTEVDLRKIVDQRGWIMAQSPTIK